MKKLLALYRPITINQASKQPSLRINSLEHMTRIILIGSCIVACLLLFLLVCNFLMLRQHYTMQWITIGASVLIYLLVISYVIKRKYIRIAATMLLLLYASISTLILHIWGINAPVGILLFGFVILLAGVMLGAKYTISITFVVILLLVLLQVNSATGLHRPDHAMLNHSSTFGDVTSYAVIFGIFALITWISGRQMEHTLDRAVQAETALQEERDSLAEKLEEKTRSLREAQLKEIKQLYTFAELGQLTTIILHELANYLTILTLDIDDIKDRHHNSIAIERAQESIAYIDTIIDQVRNQIRESDNIQKFNPATVIPDSLDQLKKKRLDSDISIIFKRDASHQDHTIIGDPLRLSQAVIILVTNALQATPITKGSRILVETSVVSSNILISVRDFGVGIPLDERPQLFEPQKSRKGHGLGIGLYITKQIIETHFKGRIYLDSSIAYTQFTIEIPHTQLSV